MGGQKTLYNNQPIQLLKDVALKSIQNGEVRCSSRQVHTGGGGGGAVLGGSNTPFWLCEKKECKHCDYGHCFYLFLYFCLLASQRLVMYKDTPTPYMEN